MIRETANALAACVVSFVLCAVLYPAMVWGLGQLAFRHQAEGSLIHGPDRSVIGSELIAQPFSSAQYFQPRPSAAGASGYDASAASGSNLATHNPALRERIALDTARQLLLTTRDAGLKARLDRLDALQADLKARNDLKEKSASDAAAIARLEEQASAAKTEVIEAEVALGKTAGLLVPVDLVTTSGGGLDPHISPESAAFQAARVAAARGLSAERIRALIEQHTERSGRIIGAPARINVLKLNLALDADARSK